MSEKKHHNKLYRIDSCGRLRAWWIEQDGQRYRTHSSFVDNDSTRASKWIVIDKDGLENTQKVVPKEIRIERLIKSAYRKTRNRGYTDEMPMDRSCDGEGSTDTTPACQHRKSIKYDKKLWKNAEPAMIQPIVAGQPVVLTKYGMWSSNKIKIETCTHILEPLRQLFSVYPDLVLEGMLTDRTTYKITRNMCEKLRSSPDLLSDEAKDRISNDIVFCVSDIPSLGHLPFVDRELLMHEAKIIAQTDTIEILPGNKISDEKDYNNYHDKLVNSGYQGSMIVFENNIYTRGMVRGDVFKRVA